LGEGEEKEREKKLKILKMCEKKIKKRLIKKK